MTHIIGHWLQGLIEDSGDTRFDKSERDERLRSFLSIRRPEVELTERCNDRHDVVLTDAGKHMEGWAK